LLVGYLRAEDETTAFDSEGYFRNGDLARWIDERYVVVTGRAKDILLRNGEHIAPQLIEDLLLRHQHIAEVPIVGVPAARPGERPPAAIRPQSNPTPPALA